jgi:hypothetical protein
MSTGVVVLVVLGAITLVALLPAAARAVRNRMRGAPQAVIVDVRSATSHDWDTGAVQSVQTAEVLMPLAALEDIWSATNRSRCSPSTRPSTRSAPSAASCAGGSRAGCSPPAAG